MTKTTDLLDRGTTDIAEAYERLRQDIVFARIPPGAKLVIETLKRQYALGPSPLREALNRLAAEGWVEHREQRGFHVVAADPQQHLQLLKARIWAEGTALRDSIEHRTDAWEDAVVLALHRLSKEPRFLSVGQDGDAVDENPQWEQLHRRFHMTLLSQCTSAYITDFCSQLYDHAHRYRMLALRVNQGRRQEGDEHRAIAEAAMAGDAELAVRCLTEHYRRTAAIIGVEEEQPGA